MQEKYMPTFVFASIKKRFLSYVIDWFFIFLASFLLYFIIHVFSFFVGILDGYDFISRNWYYFAFSILFILSCLYFIILPSSSFSSTFGQLFLGIKQVDKNGNSISFGKSILKFLATILSKIFYVGYIFVCFNSCHQTFHEKITGVYLVER